jgi:hypothetical protein
MTQPLTTKEAAAKLGLPEDGKYLRVFLRAIGFAKVEGRYQFTTKDITSLKAKLKKWEAERQKAKEEPATT